MTEAFPLAWPVGKPRTLAPARSNFYARTVEKATRILLNEVRLMNGRDPIISTNIVLRNDGLPRSGQKQPADKGVAIYFTIGKRMYCFANDRWDKIEDNLYAVAQTINALRGIARWGTGDMVEQAFTGFVALPPNTCWGVLGVEPYAPESEIQTAYRNRAKSFSCDEAALRQLNVARDEAMELLSKRTEL